MNSLVGLDLFQTLKTYLQESVQETKKVAWPERKFVMAATGLVLIIVFFTTLLVMGVDYLFSRIFGLIFKIPVS